MLVKRHKAASIGIAAVFLVGSILGTQAILEGRRAEREAMRARRGEAAAKTEAVRTEGEANRANQARADLTASASARKAPGSTPGVQARSASPHRFTG